MKAGIYIGVKGWSDDILWTCPFCEAYDICCDDPCPKCGAVLEVEAHQK